LAIRALRRNPGVTMAAVVVLAAGGAWAAMHGARLVVRAVRRADDASSSLSIIRGIRGLVVAVAAWALAGGLRADPACRGARVTGMLA